ncbi:murein hydrolase activator EnvC family protein [Clostridium sp.]|uniref:murein hydrolase activator EnvC family protein n=1 Tax=Clostridium sp. TaxID=1506 RepID=UPI003F36E45D
MINKKIKIIALGVMVAVASNNIVVFAESSSSLENQINQNKENIDNLEDEKNNINSEKSKYEGELEGILGQIEEKSKDLDKVTAEVNEYQAQIDGLQVEINEVEEKIKSKEIEIESTEKLIVEKEKEEEESEKMLGLRLRNYYKMDMTSQYIYMIITSESISSLFSTIQSIFRLIDIDKSLIEASKKIQAELEDARKNLVLSIEETKKDKEEIVKKQGEILEAQKGFLVKQEEQQKQMDELMALEDSKSNIIASLSEKEQELAHEIGSLVAYNKELQAELDAIFADINNGGGSSGGNGGNTGGDTGGTPGGDTGGNERPPTQEGFLRPGYGVVTDSYGPRINPVTGEAGFHTGVDLGDPYGSSVYASKSGTVAYSGWISGYGNTIIIDHGQGVQTLYAHNSSLLVSVGQAVNQGDVVALVGSTGMSTGPHIHWEIRINGQHTDPTPYV